MKFFTENGFMAEYNAIQML